MSGWWGITCVLLLHRNRLGTWSWPIFAVTTVGAFVLTVVMIVEAFAFPVLAHHAPETLELDGPIMGSWTFRFVSSLALGFDPGAAG